MVTKSTSPTSSERFPGSYVEWSSIIAGTVLALAISIVLIQFSGLFGLEVFKPYQSDDKTRWMIILTCVWLFWVQLISSMAGGYVSGRMRAHISSLPNTESEVRDGTHGLLVWALGTVLAVIGGAISAYLSAVIGAAPDVAEQHREIAEHLTKNASIIFGFSAAAGSFVSAAAACYTAIKGGEHRDAHTGFDIRHNRRR